LSGNDNEAHNVAICKGVARGGPEARAPLNRMTPRTDKNE